MFLDTSGLLCCFDREDARNAQALTLFHGTPRKLIHNYILTEFIALALARGFALATTLAYVRDIAAAPSVEVLWVDEFTHELGMQLLYNRPDKRYSLCDAISFEVMRQRSLNIALTTDRHFDQEGFVRLLPASQNS